MKKGFTLIEVLLSLVILAAALSGIMVAASRCLSVVTVTRGYEIARRALEQGELDHPLIAQLAVAEIDVRGKRYEENFSYTRTHEEILEEDDLFRVRTVVESPRGNRRTRMELVQYFFTTNYPGRDFGDDL